jgi:hypothetical protein
METFQWFKGGEGGKCEKIAGLRRLLGEDGEMERILKEQRREYDGDADEEEE